MSQHIPGRGEPVGAHPIAEPARKRGPAAWLIPLALLILAVLVVLLLSRCGSDSSGSEAATTSPTVSSTAPATSSPPVNGSASSAGGGQDAGTVTANGSTLLPLTGGASDSLMAYADQAVTTRSVKVESVPADEGFWVGTGAGDRVWVQLTGAAGESPYKVKTGDSVMFTGKMIKNPAGFADKVGVTAAEGAAQLSSQGYHVAAAKSSLKLSS